MQAATLGSALLNHAVKNDLAKLRFLAERVADRLAHNDDIGARDDARLITETTAQLRHMRERMDHGTAELALELTEHRLSRLVDEALQPHRPWLESRGIVVTVSIDRDAVIRCDAAHVRELLGNLIVNAADAAPRSRGHVALRTRLRWAGLVIDVSDNGSGIDRRDWEKVFEPFFSTKHDPDRYGLGLSYGYAVMGAHGGTLRIVASSPEAGTTFAASFPRRLVRRA